MKAIDPRPTWPGSVLLACAVLASALGGCAVQKPTLKLRDIELAGMDFKKLDLLLDLAVTNPNSYQISLFALEYDLTAAGETLAGGALPRPVTPLAARQTTVVKAPVALAFKGLAPVLAKAAAEDIDYELNVKATFDYLGFKIHVPLTRRGRLPALRAPTWRLRDAKWIEGAAPKIALTFEVNNPNRFALPLRSLSGSLMAGDKPLLRVDRSSLPAVPAGKTANVTVPVEVDVAAAAEAVRALTQSAALRFEGNLHLAAPVSLHELLVQGLKSDE